MEFSFNEESELTKLGELVDIEIGRRVKRPICDVCCRPVGVCWCKNLNGTKVTTSCKLIILQHPHEEKRCLRTSPILKMLLPSQNYLEIRDKKFNSSRYPELKEILNSKNSIILYPGKNAVDLETLPPVSDTQPPYNVIILDGTWQQAKSIFYRNPSLKALKQVRISGNEGSHYVIRTQPTEDSLSTVETAALALSTLQSDPSAHSVLVEPLKLICEYQMSHGAVKHHSKEFLITSGRYEKPMGKKTRKKMRKCALKDGQLKVKELINNRMIVNEARNVVEDDASVISYCLDSNEVTDNEEETLIDSKSSASISCSRNNSGTNHAVDIDSKNIQCQKQVSNSKEETLNSCPISITYLLKKIENKDENNCLVNRTTDTQCFQKHNFNQSDACFQSCMITGCVKGGISHPIAPLNQSQTNTKDGLNVNSELGKFVMEREDHIECPHSVCSTKNRDLKYEQS